ncbi:MAG TPA: hypothetical protein VIS99_10325 [Terrimicrobiaceae bacterium]
MRKAKGKANLEDGGSSGKETERLYDKLSQHLDNAVLAAGGLAASLIRMHAPEAKEAEYLLDKLEDANRELNSIIKALDGEAKFR